MNISVVGAGYVGLVSATCLAHLGHKVICVDIDSNKINLIEQGIPPIHEIGLEKMMNEALSSGCLSATTHLYDAVLNSEISIITVATPFDGEQIDLHYIRDAARQIGRAIADKTSYHTVVVKSTVVPGTTEEVVLPLLQEHSGKQAGKDFGVGMNPEFLKEGQAVNDFMNPDRIVIGGIDKRTEDVLSGLYETFTDKEVIVTSPRTAEMIKYATNSFLATLISFSNEMANLCSAIEGIDIVDVLDGVSKDKRFSPILENGDRVVPAISHYLEAGCGFGGSCFPKDIKSLISFGERHTSPMQLLSSVISINEEQPKKLIALVKSKHSRLVNLKVAILGLAFKPGTDDVRESPALKVLASLAAEGARLNATDPIAIVNAQKALPDLDVNYCEEVKDCIEGAQVIIIITSWPVYKKLPELLKPLKAQPLVIDGRRLLRNSDIENYLGIGLT